MLSVYLQNNSASGKIPLNNISKYFDITNKGVYYKIVTML